MSEETGNKPGEFGTVVGGLSLTSERKGKMGRYDPDHYTVSEGMLKFSSQSQLAEVFLPTGVPALGCSWLLLITLWGTCRPAPK